MKKQLKNAKVTVLRNMLYSGLIEEILAVDGKIVSYHLFLPGIPKSAYKIPMRDQVWNKPGQNAEPSYRGYPVLPILCRLSCKLVRFRDLCVYVKTSEPKRFARSRCRPLCRRKESAWLELNRLSNLTGTSNDTGHGTRARRSVGEGIRWEGG
jgi:hypothetical protein